MSPATVTPEDSLAELRMFLGSGAAFQHTRDKPSCIETHAALVLLAGDRVLKLKKPVNLGHVDLTTLAAREHLCREELRVNRELAGPEMYRAVRPVLREAGGGLALGAATGFDTARVVDWVIEMHRLPASAMLDNRLADGQPVRATEIEAAADVMIGFYRAHRAPPGAAETCVSRFRGVAVVNGDNLRALHHHLPKPLNEDMLKLGTKQLDQVGTEIVARGDAGLLCEGHGDLRPEHVCLVDPPMIFDRLEFDPSLRIVDPFDEFNYLGLECDMLGAGWIRACLLRRLDQAGFTPPSPALLAAYGVHRCLTRARLALDHLNDTDIRTPEKWPALAQRYLDLAARIANGDHSLQAGPLP